MTISNDVPATLPHAFAFARRQLDPKFREYLADIGWTADHHVLIAFDDEPIAAVVERIIFNEPPGACLIAIPHEGDRFGFRLMFAEVRTVRHRLRMGSHVAIPPETSIGMLWSSGEKCEEYVPSEWSRPVVFEKVRTPA